MREICTSGSERGAPSNRRSYRDGWLALKEFSHLGTDINRFSKQGTGVIDDLADLQKAANKLGICFTGETLVQTNVGHKEIKDIRVGDLVFAENVETGEKGFKIVKQLFVTNSYTLLHISFKDTIIKTTLTHPFYVVGKGWVEARELHVDDLLRLSNGEFTKVKSIQIERLETPVKVYNFEVADWHTYYVSKY